MVSVFGISAVTTAAAKIKILEREERFPSASEFVSSYVCNQTDTYKQTNDFQEAKYFRHPRNVAFYKLS